MSFSMIQKMPLSTQGSRERERGSGITIDQSIFDVLEMGRQREETGSYDDEKLFSQPASQRDTTRETIISHDDEDILDRITRDIEDVYSTESQSTPSTSSSADPRKRDFEEFMELVRGNHMSRRLQTYARQGQLETEVRTIDYNNIYWREMDKQIAVDVNRILTREVRKKKVKMWATRIMKTGNVLYSLCIPLTAIGYMPASLATALSIASISSDVKALSSIITQMKLYGLEYFILRSTGDEAPSLKNVFVDIFGAGVSGILYAGGSSAGSIASQWAFNNVWGGRITGAVTGALTSGIGSTVLDVVMLSFRDEQRVNPLVQRVLDDRLKARRLETQRTDFERRVYETRNPIQAGLGKIRRGTTWLWTKSLENLEEGLWTMAYLGTLFSPEIFQKVFHQFKERLPEFVRDWSVEGSSLIPQSVKEAYAEKIAQGVLSDRRIKASELNRVLVYPLAQYATKIVRSGVHYGLEKLPESLKSEVDQLSQKEVKFLNKSLGYLGNLAGVDVQQRITYGFLFDISMTAAFTEALVQRSEYNPVIMGYLVDQFIHGDAQTAICNAAYYMMDPKGVLGEYEKTGSFVSPVSGRVYNIKDSIVFMNEFDGGESLSYVDSRTGTITMVGDDEDFLRSSNGLSGRRVTDVVGERGSNLVRVNVQGTPSPQELQMAYVQKFSSGATEPPSPIILKTLFNNSLDNYRQAMENYQTLSNAVMEGELLIHIINRELETPDLKNLRPEERSTYLELLRREMAGLEKSTRDVAAHFLTGRYGDASSRGKIEAYQGAIKAGRERVESNFGQKVTWERENVKNIARRAVLMDRLSRMETDFTTRIDSMRQATDNTVNLDNQVSQVIGDIRRLQEKIDDDQFIPSAGDITSLAKSIDKIQDKIDQGYEILASEANAEASRFIHSHLDHVNMVETSIDGAYHDGKLTGDEYRDRKTEVASARERLTGFLNDRASDIRRLKRDVEQAMENLPDIDELINRSSLLDLGNGAETIEDHEMDLLTKTGEAFLEDIPGNIQNIDEVIWEWEIRAQSSVEGTAEHQTATQTREQMIRLRTQLKMGLSMNMSVIQLGRVVSMISKTHSDAVSKTEDSMTQTEERSSLNSATLNLIDYGLTGLKYASMGLAFTGGFVLAGGFVGTSAMVATGVGLMSAQTTKKFIGHSLNYYLKGEWLSDFIEDNKYNKYWSSREETEESWRGFASRYEIDPSKTGSFEDGYFKYMIRNWKDIVEFT